MKNGLKWVIGAVIVIGIIFILAYFNLFKQSGLDVSVPIVPFPTESLSNSYTCPLGVSSCKVQGKIECITPSNPPKVYLRVDPNWVAWDWDNDGSLECFIKGVIRDGGSKKCNMNITASYTISRGILNGKMLRVSDGYYVYAKEQEVNTNYCPDDDYSYILGTGCNTADECSNNNCSINEFTYGTTKRYTCNGLFEIRDKEGNLKYSEPLSVFSDNMDNDTSLIQSDPIFKPEDRASISGSDIPHLYYGTSVDVEGCNYPTNVCNADKTGFYNCLPTNVLDKSNLTYCQLDKGDICMNGKCTFPLNYDISFVDSNGNERAGFSPTDSINIKSKITTLSNSITSAKVEFLVYKYGSETPTTYSVNTYDFTKDQSVYTAIANPGAAYLGQQFYAVVKITYNNRAIYVGKDNKDYSFRIGTQLDCNGNFESNINGQTRSTLYSGYPVDLKVYTSESGLASPADLVIPSVKLNGVNITLTKKSEGGSGSKVYSYVYEFTPQSTGPLDASVEIQKSGVSQKCSITSQRVESLTITPEFVDMARYLQSCVAQNTPLTFIIETKDSLEQLVDVMLVLKAIPSETTLQQDVNVTRLSLGRYQFTYNFPSLGSTYFQVSSQAFSGINSGAIDVLSDCNPPECVQNNDCVSKGADYVCSNGKCIPPEPPWLLYISIGVAVVLAVIIIIFVIKLVRKTGEVSTGFEL